MSDLTQKPATELAALVKSRAVSPVEVMDAVLTAAEATQSACNAFITVDGERAMETAREQESALM